VPHAEKWKCEKTKFAWLDGSEQPRLEASGIAVNTPPGHVGIRACGAPVSVDELMLNAEGRLVDALADGGSSQPKP
jgi:hypothetical protein